jgi:hypothetical protein
MANVLIAVCRWCFCFCGETDGNEQRERFEWRHARGTVHNLLEAAFQRFSADHLAHGPGLFVHRDQLHAALVDFYKVAGLEHACARYMHHEGTGPRLYDHMAHEVRIGGNVRCPMVLDVALVQWPTLDTVPGARARLGL